MNAEIDPDDSADDFEANPDLAHIGGATQRCGSDSTPQTQSSYSFMNGASVASTASYGNMGTNWTVQALNAD